MITIFHVIPSSSKNHTFFTIATSLVFLLLNRKALYYHIFTHIVFLCIIPIYSAFGTLPLYFEVGQSNTQLSE